MPRFVKSHRRLFPQDFNPLRAEQHRISLAALSEHLSEISRLANLPKSLSEEEIERRWQEYCNATATSP